MVCSGSELPNFLITSLREPPATYLVTRREGVEVRECKRGRNARTREKYSLSGYRKKYQSIAQYSYDGVLSLPLSPSQCWKDAIARDHW